MLLLREFLHGVSTVPRCFDESVPKYLVLYSINRGKSASFPDLVCPPDVVVPVLLVLALDDLQLGEDGDLAEERALEEGDEPAEGLLQVRGGDVEVEVGVLGGGVRVGAAPALAWGRKSEVSGQPFPEFTLCLLRPHMPLPHSHILSF